MRMLAVALAVASLGRLDADVNAYVPSGLAESLPEFFLKIVNKNIKGSIRTSRASLVGASTVALEDAILFDPSGVEVGRVSHVEATVSLASALAGELVISKIEARDPRLGLVYDDGKLNLLEAFAPRKALKEQKPAEGQLRIDTIIAHGGGFTFTDKKNVSLEAENIEGAASFEMDLKHKLVVLDVKEPKVASGVVKLAQLDVPLTKIAAQSVRVLMDRVEIVGATANASGAKASADGTVFLTNNGALQLKGVVDAPKNAWPERLHRLPFDTPPVHANVSVTGAFSDPHVNVDGAFQKASAYGYDVDAGRGVVEVTKDAVRILDGSYLKAGGTVAAVGTVKLPSLDMDVKLRAIDVPIARALEPAELEPAPKGVVNGRATLSGIADGEKPITIDAKVTGHGAVISAVKVRGDVDGSAHVVVRPKTGKVTVETATLKGDRIDAKGSGDVFTDEERIAFQVEANVDDPTAMVPQVPDDIHAEHATFTGTIAGPYKNVHVDGIASADKGVAYGVPVAKLRGHVNASADDVLIDDTHALAAAGVVDVKKPIRVALKGKHAITGVATVTGADLSKIRSTSGEKLPIAGRADMEATITGPYDDPTVKLRAAAGGLVVSGEELGQATAIGTATRQWLIVDSAQIQGGIAQAHSEEVRLHIDDLVVDGHVHIEALDLARIDATKSAKLTGTARGIAVVRGNVYAPDIDAKLSVESLSAGGQRYGDGNVDLLVAPDTFNAVNAKRAAPGTSKNAKPSAPKLSTPAAADDVGHIVSVAAHFGEEQRGTFDVRASYAVERKVVNAIAKLDQVDITPFTSQLGTSVAPLQGFVSGAVDAHGPLDKLDLRLRLHSDAIAVPRAEKGTASAPTSSPPPLASAPTTVATLRTLGPVDVDARMQAGTLNAQVCAFNDRDDDDTPGPNPGSNANTPKANAPNVSSAADTGSADEASPCSASTRLWATVVGDVDVSKSTFDLAVDGVVDESDLDDIFPALAARSLEVSAKAKLSAQLVKTENQPVDVRAQATLLAASVQPPGSLRADLVDTAEVLYADDRVQLTKPARFRAPGGDVDVIVGGSVGTKDIAIDVNGSLALGVAKAFTQQIANAQGTAATKLAVRGTYANGVTVEGTLTPAAGSSITPRALGAPIMFLPDERTKRVASIAFAPTPQDRTVIRVSTSSLQAHLGEQGVVTVHGSADVRTSRTSDQGLVARWDLAVTGTGVGLRFGGVQAEGAVDVSLVGDEAEPKLRGRVEVTDGLFRKHFELRNFVLEATPEKESDPLWQTLAPIGLENLDLDLALAIQNFRTRINVATFDADLRLRGNLQLTKTLRLPQLDGAVEAEDGTIDFPRARFDVEEMQVEFPSGANGKFDPHVSLTAHAELPPGATGANDTEIPVELSVDGDFQKGLNLDLSATDPQRVWTRSDLLGFIVFGRTTLTAGVTGGVDTNLAVRALMSEAALPLTSQLEEFTRRSLGVQIELDPGGWHWQIGRRLQLEGPGLFVPQASTATTGVTGATAATTTTSTYVPGYSGSAYGAASLAAAAATSPATAEDAVRLRLLIFDPFFIGPVPLGKNLSLVGSSSSLGQEVRLSLRFVEQ